MAYMKDSDGRRLDNARVRFASESVGRPVPAIWKLGDSISANGITLPTGSADRVWSTDFDYLAWACLLSMGRIRYGGVAATGGFRTDQIITTHLPTVLAARPAYCVVHCGTNDIGTLTAAQTRTNLATIFTALLNAGITPIATTMLPKETNTGSNREALDSMSAYVSAYAQKYGFPVVDWTTPFIDPDGSWQSYTNPTPGAFNYDDVHPNGAGAKKMGQQLLAALSPALPPAPPGLATTTNYLSDFVLSKVNALLITDTNADGVADNITAPAATGAVYSLTSMTTDEGKGKWQNAERTSSGNATLDTVAVTVAPGDRIRFSCKVKTTGIKSGSGTWHLRLTTSAIVDVTALRNFKEDVELGLWEVEFTVPTGVTTLKLYAYVSAGTGKLSIGEVNMVNLTTKGLVLA